MENTSWLSPLQILVSQLYRMLGNLSGSNYYISFLGIPPLTNTTRVLVRVGISGNQRPIFKGHFQNVENLPVIGPPSYRVSIPENAPSGYNVTAVSAHDPDGLDSLLRYRIVGANDNFQIDEL